MSYDKLKIDVANPELLLKNKRVTNEKKGHIFNYSEGRKEKRIAPLLNGYHKSGMVIKNTIGLAKMFIWVFL